MIYTVVEKKEEMAPEILYGAGAKRFTLTLEHHHQNGIVDNYRSRLYVDELTFAKYGIGEKIYVDLAIVYAESFAPIDVKLAN
jgi:hypothetical protein